MPRARDLGGPWERQLLKPYHTAGPSSDLNVRGEVRAVGGFPFLLARQCPVEISGRRQRCFRSFSKVVQGRDEKLAIYNM